MNVTERYVPAACGSFYSLKLNKVVLKTNAVKWIFNLVNNHEFSSPVLSVVYCQAVSGPIYKSSLR